MEDYDRMPHYAIRTRATRPDMRATGLNEHERAAHAKHVPWLQAQLDAGMMIFVGRTAISEADGWAVAVIKADSEDAARQIMTSRRWLTLDGCCAASTIPRSISCRRRMPPGSFRRERRTRAR